MENYIMRKIGVISDTHSIVNEKIKDIFKECEMIIHAGDIGSMEVINALETIAPGSWYPV